MVAGIVNACGGWGGRMIPSGPDNKKGFFENIEIRQDILKPYIVGIGGDQLGQDPLPPIPPRRTTAIQEESVVLRNKVYETINSQGYLAGPWFYKDAKLALTWDIWTAAFPMATWILVRRDRTEIAKSCMRTGFMRCRNSLEDWIAWVLDYEKRFGLMRTYLPVYEVWTESIVDRKTDLIQSAIEHVGLHWDNQSVFSFIDKSLLGK